MFDFYYNKVKKGYSKNFRFLGEMVESQSSENVSPMVQHSNE